jgi:tetratricopeptide (TPR) repeat protein
MGIKDYLDKQDWDAVMAECTTEINNSAKNNTTFPYSVYAYMHRGYAHCFVPQKDENYKDAIEDLSKAVTLAPDDTECLFKRAYAYWLSGRYDCAIADCKKVIASISPDIVFKICALINMVKEAAIIAQGIVASKDPAKYQEIEVKANKLKTEADQLVKDADALKTAVQEIADKAQEAVGAANEAVKNNDDKKAQEATDKLKEAADKARNIVPSYIASAHELLGNIYFALDDPLKAVEQYKKALQLNPCSPSLLDNSRKARERLNSSR